MIEAGSETTSMQLNNMLIGILSDPEILIKAHEELDRVVGSERPPNFNDEPRLPYIRAIVKVRLVNCLVGYAILLLFPSWMEFVILGFLVICWDSQ
jgi:hypothetical protein